MKTYLVYLTERNRDREYTEKLLITCQQEDEGKYLDALILTWQDNVTGINFDDFGYISTVEINNCECVLEIENWSNIPPEHANILKSFDYIKDVTPNDAALKKAEEIRKRFDYEYGKTTYLVEVTEINGEYEYTDKCLISCHPENLEITLQSLVVFWRGIANRVLENSVVKTENGSIYSLSFKIEMDFCHILLSNFRSIPDSELPIISKYLYDVTPDEEKIEKTRKFLKGEYSFEEEIKGVELYDDEED